MSEIASLVSHSVNYFEIVNRTEDNRSQLAEETGESGSESDNASSMNPEGSDHEYLLINFNFPYRDQIEDGQLYGDSDQSQQSSESEREDDPVDEF